MLSITPRVSMFDSPVVITVQGLQPGQKVTISAQIDHVTGKFESFAYLKADDHGCIDLRRNASQGGTYEGIHPMGLFTTLQQSPNQRSGLRLMPRKVDKPMQYRFSLIKDHGFHESATKIDSVIIDRHFLHPMVERREIEVGRIRGTLFMPKNRDGRKVPAIVDIFGVGGGLIEHRGALLASKGFVVLSLAYFGYKDLPDSLDQIDLNYFEEAIDWFTSQPNVTDQVGFIGTSLGATIGALCGIHFPKLKAVAWISGCHMLTVLNPLKWNGVPFPTLTGKYDDVKMTKEGVIAKQWAENIQAPEEAIFHIETCPRDTKWLLVSASDDHTLCSVKSAKVLEQRLINAGRGSQVQAILLKGAGHLLEPPFMPLCRVSYHMFYGQNAIWGGEKYSHAEGQDEMWKNVIEFFSANIGAPQKLPEVNEVIFVKSSL